MPSHAYRDALTHAVTYAVTCAQWGVERSGSVQYADVSWAHSNGDDGASAGLPPRLVPAFLKLVPAFLLPAFLPGSCRPSSLSSAGLPPLAFFPG